MPPGMPGAPAGGPPGGGTGAASTVGPMAGQGQQAVAGVKLAIEALQKSLMGLPMGAPIHTAVLKAITDISKNLDDAGAHGGDQSAVIQQLAQLARAQQEQPGQSAMMQKLMPGGGSGGAPPPPTA